jgi:PST family polysaccharide transporter
VSLRKQVARGLAWTSLESFGLSGLSLICLAVFTRYLTARDFGVSAVALAIVQIAGVPAELLFHDALIQRRELDALHANSAFTVAVALGVCACSLCWWTAPVIEVVAHEPGLAVVLRWMSLSLLGTGFASVLTALQRRRLQFRAVAVRSLVGRAGSALLGIALAVSHAGIWALVVQQVSLVWLGAATLWWLSAERPRFQFTWAHTRELVRFGWISLVWHLLGMLRPRVYMVLVGALLGSAAAGLLSVAMRGLDMLRDLLVGALSHVAAPLYARLRDDRAAMAEVYTRSVQMTGLVAYPLFVGLATCSEEVVLVMFGPKWSSAAHYFALVALFQLPYFYWMYSAAVFNALNKPSLPAVNVTIELAYLTVAMLLFGRSSLDNALLVWVSRFALVLPIGMSLLKAVSGIGFGSQARGALVPGLSAAGMAALVILAKRAGLDALPAAARLVPIALIGATAYCALVWILDRALLQQFLGFVKQAVPPRS